MTASGRRRATVLGTLAAVAVCSAALHADLTVVQTTTIEGGVAAMAGQAMSPKTTMRIKGLKSRNDIDAQIIQVSTIGDLSARQVIVLRPDQKTAQILTITPAGAAADPAAGTIVGPSVDGSVTPTGKSQVIDGVKCDEYAFSTTLKVSDMNPGGAAVPPEAAEMMKGMQMVMKGSLWVAKDVPGVADYVAYQKAAGSVDFASLMTAASGMSMPGMEKLMKAMGGLAGMAYLTEMTMTVEGTGQMAEMIQQMGPMKVTTKVTSITTDPIPDDVFSIPEGYTVIKQ